MRNMKVLAFLVLSAFLAFSCSKDDSSTGPSGGGNSNSGSLSTHSSGKNLPVTQANVDSVSQVVTTTTYEVFGKALEAAAVGRAKPAVDVPLNGTVNGAVSGHATVAGKYIVSADYSTINYNFTCTFFDYSDDGILYYGGGITYTGSMIMNPQSYNLTFKGGLKFNGAYDGAQDFTTTYVYNMSTGSINIQSTINTTSGGKTFSTQYKYPE